MKNLKPLVSVIMPVFNTEQYIVDAIESIIHQKYPNFELIIVDDASTDNTPIILKQYAERYPNLIKVHTLKHNLGRGGDAAANIAYRQAKGEFVARTDADDIAMPDRIEKQVRFLINNPQIGIVGTNAYVINSLNEIVGEKKVLLNHSEIYDSYFVFHPMINPTIMVRRSAITNPNDLYLTDNPTNNDYLTFMKRISSGIKFANLPEKLVKYRIHEQNDSLRKVKKTFRNSLVTRFRAITEFGYHPSLISLVKCLAQIVLVFLLPERLVFNLYLLIRGINKPQHISSPLNLPVERKLRKVSLQVANN